MANVTRRHFIAAAGATAAASAVAANVALADEAAEASVNMVTSWGKEYPWPAEPPAIADDQVEETIECDVVVCGLGVAGCASFRSACEEGVKVVAIEKADSPQCRSSQYCYVNGTMAEQLGLGEMDVDKVAKEEWECSGLYADYAIIRKFVKNEADVFDWWANGDPEMHWQEPGEEVDMMAAMMGGEMEHPYMVMSMTDASIDYEKENQTSYPTRLSFTNHQHVLDENVQRGIEAGGEVYYGHFGEQLIVEDGRVCGIYARNCETGMYKKIMAANGVVLATGGCEGNKEMALCFYPMMAEYNNLSCWPNFDAEGNPTNTGDGYRMGAWAGAAFSPFMAPMCHVMGGPNDVANMNTSMGLTAPALFLNYNGVRFINEDSNCSDCEVSVEKQPKTKFFLICDKNIGEFSANSYGEGSSYTAEQLDEMIDNEVYFKGETLEELFDAIVAYDADFNKEAALASVERYNEMCAAGYDDDFCKQEEYLVAIEEGPFYAQRTGIGLCLTTMGGLFSDSDARVYNNDKFVIPGLYACGNVQGNRFAVKYPFKLSGASHAMAMYYGYVAGKNVAAGI